MREKVDDNTETKQWKMRETLNDNRNTTVENEGMVNDGTGIA